MKIETKFNIGDLLWFSFASEAISMIAREIRISGGESTAIQYDSGMWNVSEEDLFATKEELLSSIN